MAIAAAARRAFDLDAQPHAIDGHLSRDATLRPFVRAMPGIRVPGGFDAFELAARAVLGQQVTVRGATTLAGRLAREFGEQIETSHASLSAIFPSAHRIARARHLEAIGLVPARAAALRDLASRDLIDESITSIKGIGPWTAQYVAMRALRSPDAFPSTDLVLRRFASITRADAWSPWRAYAAMHLWRNA